MRMAPISISYEQIIKYIAQKSLSDIRVAVATPIRNFGFATMSLSLCVFVPFFLRSLWRMPHYVLHLHFTRPQFVSFVFFCSGHTKYSILVETKPSRLIRNSLWLLHIVKASDSRTRQTACCYLKWLHTIKCVTVMFCARQHSSPSCTASNTLSVEINVSSALLSFSAGKYRTLPSKPFIIITIKLLCPVLSI